MKQSSFTLGEINPLGLSMEYLKLTVRGIRNAQVAYGVAMRIEAACQMWPTTDPWVFAWIETKHFQRAIDPCFKKTKKN